MLLRTMLLLGLLVLAGAPDAGAQQAAPPWPNRPASFEQPVPPGAGATPLSPPADARTLRLQPAGEQPRKPLSTAPSLLAMLGSLAVVLGLFLAAAWMLRRGMPQSAQRLPNDVVEMLGRAPLAGRQQLQLIRCGNKLLLVAVSTAGVETLTEITEPAEVDRLAGLCRQARPDSASVSFGQTLAQLGRKREGRGFLGLGRGQVHITDDDLPAAPDEDPSDA